MPLLAALALLSASEPPDRARELFEKAAERHYALRQYDVEVRTSTVTGDRLQPGERVRLTVDEEARAFHVRYLTGGKQEAVSDGERLWVRMWDGVREHPADGPAARLWRQGIEVRSGRFALLGRSALDAEWVKQEELKRGKRRIPCGVIRIRPGDPIAGNWTEMLWIETATGLIWRTVWIERASPPSVGMQAPPAAQGGGPRVQPMMSWDTVRTRDYDWLHAEGELAPGTIARPEWARSGAPTR